MSNTFQDFLAGIDKAVAKEPTKLPSDFCSAMEAVGATVESWLRDHSLVVDKKTTHQTGVLAAVESYDLEMMPSTLGVDAILDLCQQAHVAQEHLASAAKRVATLLNATLGCKNGTEMLAKYNARPNTDKTFLSVESLFPVSVPAGLFDRTPALEAFGINMDRVEPDLKTILTISLLQFHTSLTPRVVPIQTITQGNVTIVRESMNVYDMSKPEQKPTRVLELYRDPTMVSVVAKRIVPKFSNDTEKAFLIQNGVYKLEKTCNLFALAIDAKRPGYEKFNHTDFVEDNIILDGLLAIVTEDPQGTPKKLATMIKIPDSRGRLTQITNDVASTIRRLSLDFFQVSITKDTKEFTFLTGPDGEAPAGYTPTSTLFDDFKDGKRLVLDIHANVKVDRKTALADATAWLGSAKVVNADGSIDDSKTIAVEFVGYTLNARYNEDNKRKTSVRAEVNRRSMSYELPTGRNFVVDTAIGQDGMTNAAAHLAQLEHIGRDHTNLRIIYESMAQVHDQIVTSGNDAATRVELATQYAAGDIVAPFVYMDKLDFSNLYAIRSADASGDVKQYVKTYFNRLTSALRANTFFDQQLAEGATPTFRVITSPAVLGDVFKVKHIHAHLETDERGAAGVEHVIQLDNGTRLEIVTTTFDSMKDRIIMIPYLANSQNSILNFGTNYDQGTLVGALSIAGDGGPAYHRLFSVTRELLIPTNVIGAIIEVVGTEGINVADSSANFTFHDADLLPDVKFDMNDE